MKLATEEALTDYYQDILLNRQIRLNDIKTVPNNLFGTVFNIVFLIVNFCKFFLKNTKVLKKNADIHVKDKEK